MIGVAKRLPVVPWLVIEKVPPAHVVGLELFVSRPVSRVVDRPCQTQQVQPVGILDDRRSARRGNCRHADALISRLSRMPSSDQLCC